MSKNPDRVPVSTCESLGVRIHADSDPTADTVQFFFSEGADTDQPADSDFIAGSWVSGSWDAKSKTAEARTHTAGASDQKAPAQTVTAGDRRLWARIITATEAPVIDCGMWTFY